MTYGPMHGINSFFNSPSVPKEELGGWYVEGQSKSGEYLDVVWPCADWPEACYVLVEKMDDWWYRHELKKGDPLLSAPATPEVAAVLAVIGAS